MVAGHAGAGLEPGGDDGISMSWYTIDGGGGSSTLGMLSMDGTIGQHDTGTMTLGAVTMTGGFWAWETPPPPCPGDSDGSGDVDVNDLVAVITDWGTDGSANGGDVDGDGVVNVDDLVSVFENWGPCPAG